MLKTTIEALKFGQENNGFSYDDLINHLNKKGYDFGSNKQINRNTTLMITTFRSYFMTLDGEKIQDNFNGLYYINTEGLSFLLSHEALEQSKKAIYWATLSFWLAAFSALATIIFK